MNHRTGNVDRCPKCGGELFYGYGLMGGGIGTYEGCDEDGCDYFYKEQDAEDDTPFCDAPAPSAPPREGGR